jgi:hypothetical protein
LSAGISSAAATIFFEKRSMELLTAFDTGFVSGWLACCALNVNGRKASAKTGSKNCLSFKVSPPVFLAT